MWGSSALISTRRYGGRIISCNRLRGTPPLLACTAMFECKRGLLSSPIDGVGELLTAFHSSSGLPWWCCITASGVTVRYCTLPAVWVQMRAQGRMSKSIPDIRRVWTAYSGARDRTPASDIVARTRNTRLLLSGIRASLTLHSVSLTKIFLPVLVNIPLLITTMVGIRRLIISKGHLIGMSEGGALWFVDLTTKDTTFVLPVSVVMLSYLSMEIGLMMRANTGFMTQLKDVMQSLLILGLSIFMQLPSGVLLLPCVNSCFTMAQTVALSSPLIRSSLRLPTLPSGAQEQTPSSTPRDS